MNKFDLDILDLYSAEQTIKIDEKKSSYDLKFKIESYYNEQLLITVPDNYLFLDCRKQKNELVCPVTKDQFIENLEGSNTSLTGQNYIHYLDYTYQIKSGEIPMITEINILYENVVKEDIYVGITKCLTNYTELKSYVIYETNITNIKKVKASLHLEALEKDGSSSKIGCRLVKHEINPLYLMCEISFPEFISIKEITKEIVFNDINVKYNFRIQPYKFEKFNVNVNQIGGIMALIYPEVFDFSKKSELDFYLYSAYPDNVKGLSYNENGDELNCKKNNKITIKCTVSKNHFKGKANGYYFIRRKNSLNISAISYETPPVKVILNKGNIIKYSLVYLLLIFIFL